MSNKLKTVVMSGMAVVFLLGSIAWMAGFFERKLEPGIQTVRLEVPEDLFKIKAKEVQSYEAVPASVEAKFGTVISSRTLSRVTKMHVRAGDSVVQGQLLVELEKTDLLAMSQQAREHIRGVTAHLTEAEKNLKRVKRLQGQGIVPMAELDKARANRDSLTAELAAAKQALEQAQSAVGYAEIRSPIDGRVVDRFSEPGDTASPGKKLLSLYNPLTLRIEAHVREQLALSLDIGQSLKIDIPAMKGQVSGVVEEQVPVAESGSRSFLIKASIQQENHLLPGMYARMLVPAELEQLLFVPSERVVEVGQLNVVWVWEDGLVLRRFVRTGKHQDSLVQILSGLEEGDLLMMPPAS